MSRRATTAVGALLSATVLASGSAAAQPALEDAGIAQLEDVVIDEIGAELDPVLSGIEGGFIELRNTSEANVDISDWELFGCTTGDSFSHIFADNTVLSSGESYLIGDINFRSFGNVPDAVLPEVLEQDGGGVELLDDAFPPNVEGEVKWGTPESSCSGLPDAGVSPDDDDSIHFNTTPPPPWCKLPPAIGQSKSC